MILQEDKAEVDRHIRALANMDVSDDPLIADRHIRRQTAIVERAQKRHGLLIERAVLNYIAAGRDIHATNVTTKEWSGKRQLDIVAYHRRRRVIVVIEVKRGSNHDAGKKRDIRETGRLVQKYGHDLRDIMNAPDNTPIVEGVLYAYNDANGTMPWSRLSRILDVDPRGYLGVVTDYFRNELDQLLNLTPRAPRKPKMSSEWLDFFSKGGTPGTVRPKYAAKKRCKPPKWQHFHEALQAYKEVNRPTVDWMDIPLLVS